MKAKSPKRFYKRLGKSSQKRLIKVSIVIANVAVLVTVGFFVLRTPHNVDVTAANSISSSINNDNNAVNALDQLSAADIAVHVARLTGLEEAVSVANKADTVNAQLAVSPADETIVAKPQVVATALKSRRDIQTYVTKDGDTVPKLAAQFGVTSDTIRWSNGLTGDAIAVGRQLIISPVNGIVYTVKQGDTADSLAAKFKANKEQIIIFNDAELSGLKVGERIVIPDGNATPAPLARSSASTAYAGFAWGGAGPVYGGNGYDYGYCTWWAAVRRAQVGKPIPSNLGNASTWKVLAQRAGFGVGNKPQQYAVIWTPPRDYYGHVGFVESVNADGSVNVSEMNVAGWGRVSRKTLSPAEAAAYSYIY